MRCCRAPRCDSYSHAGARAPAADGAAAPRLRVTAGTDVQVRPLGKVRARRRSQEPAPDGAAALRASGSPLGRTSMSVLAAVAHPCATCPGCAECDVLWQLEARASTGVAMKPCNALQATLRPSGQDTPAASR